MSQSSVTEKRTVITTSSSSSYDEGDAFIKPNIGTRATNIISRSSTNPVRNFGGSGGSVITRTVEYGYGHGMSPGSYGNITSGGAQTIKQTREKEKKDMQDLNERFAGYIEKVRFLEAQNRKLGNELDELRGKWGRETGLIKQMYEAELKEARKLIDDLSKDKASLEIKASSLQEQMSDIQRQLDEAKKYRQIDRDQINKLNQQLADYESEINMLRRSLASLETERDRDRTTIQRLQMEVDKLRIDLNNETLAHLDAENRRQTLEEEIEFLKKVHEQELKELAALAYRDTTAENREFWKNELGQAIREIQHEYDSKVDQIRGDLESFYNLKIQEFRTGSTKQNMEVTHVREENKKLIKQMTDLKGRLADLEARNAQLEKQYQDLLREYESKDADHALEIAQYKEEISKLRAEMEGILAELQSLMDAKLSLELEIAAYRKLLECEENRVDVWRATHGLVRARDGLRPRFSYSPSEPTRPKEPEDIQIEEHVVKTETAPLSPDSQTETACSLTSGSSEQPQIPETEEEMRQIDDNTVNLEPFATPGKELVDECEVKLDSTEERKDDIKEELVESVSAEMEISGQTEGDGLSGVSVDNGTKETVEANKLCEEGYELIEDTPNLNGKVECEINEIESEKTYSKSRIVPDIIDEKASPNELLKDSGIADTDDNQELKGEESKTNEIEEEHAPKTEDEPQTIETSVKIVISPSSSHDKISNASVKGNALEPSSESMEIHEQSEEKTQEIAVEQAMPINTGLNANEDITTDRDEDLTKSTAKGDDLEFKKEDQIWEVRGEERLMSPSSEVEETQSPLKETETAQIEPPLETENDERICTTEQDADQQEASPEEGSEKHTELQEKDNSKELDSLANVDDNIATKGVDLPDEEADSETRDYEKDIDTTTIYTEEADTKTDLIIQEDIHFDESGAKSPVEEDNTNVQTSESSHDHLEETLGTGEEHAIDTSIKDIDPNQSAVEIVKDTEAEKADDQEITSPPKLNAENSQSPEDENYAKVDSSSMELDGVINISASNDTKGASTTIDISTSDVDKEYFDQEETNISKSKLEIEESKDIECGSVHTDSEDDRHTSAKDQSDIIYSQDEEDLQKDNNVSEVIGANNDDCSEIQEKVQEEEATMPTETEDTHMSLLDDKQNADVESSTGASVSGGGRTSMEQHDDNDLDVNIENEQTDTAENVESKTSEANEPLARSVSSDDASDSQLREKAPDGMNESNQMSAEAKVDEIKGEDDSSDAQIILQNGDSETDTSVPEVIRAKPESAVNGFQEQSGDDLISDTTDEQVDSQVSMKMMRGEVSAKTTYQRTSTGPIAISEVSPEGKFIVLENTSSGPNRREVNLDGWKIKRTVDGKHDYIYPFRNFTLKAGKRVKILARGSAAEAGLNDLVFRDEDTWGVGSQVTTVLINEKDEEKASHIQKTLYN